MGKKHNSSKEEDDETVSNLDSELKQDACSDKKNANWDRMPARINFRHKFADEKDGVKTRSRKGFFKKHGELAFAGDFPAKCICLLKITAKDQDGELRDFYGTGFMISPRIIITAGHNVFFGGGWAERIIAIPGADGTYAPYGSEIAAELISTNNWVNRESIEHDYGALILPSDDLFNRVQAHFQFVEIRKTSPIMIWGYPISKRFKLVTLHGSSSGITPFMMEYNLPTEIGNSGSPVFIVLNNQIVVAALHTMGGSPCSGVRVNPNVAAKWNEWIARSVILT